MLGQITFLDKESEIFLKSKLEESETLRNNLELKTIELKKMEEKNQQQESTVNGMISQKNNLELSLKTINNITVDTLPANFGGKNRSFDNFKAIDEYIRQKYKDKNSVIDESTYIDISSYALKLDQASKGEIKEKIKSMKNMLKGNTQKNLFLNFFNNFEEFYDSNMEKLEKINSIELEISSLKNLKDEIPQINSEIELLKLDLVLKNKDIKAYLTNKNVNWIQFGGSYKILIDKIMMYDQLVNEINIKYIDIKSRLKKLEKHYEYVLKKNKDINFIKLIILLSIKYQEKYPVTTYVVLKRKNLQDIYNKIEAINKFKDENLENKVSIYVNNYKILLDLLQKILFKLTNTLDDIKGINVLKSTNPSKKYIDFLNLNLNLINKLYELII